MRPCSRFESGSALALTLLRTTCILSQPTVALRSNPAGPALARERFEGSFRLRPWGIATVQLDGPGWAGPGP